MCVGEDRSELGVWVLGRSAGKQRVRETACLQRGEKLEDTVSQGHAVL